MKTSKLAISMVILLCTAFVHEAEARTIRTLGWLPLPNQKDAPVRVVGMAGGGYPIQLENITGSPVSKYPIEGIKPDQFPAKKVVAIQLGWVTEVPPGCSTMAVSPTVNRSQVQEVTLEPGEIISTRMLAGKFDHTAMMSEGVKFNVRRQLVVIGLVYVKFEDGTEWRFDLPREGSFDNHEFVKHAACTPESDKRLEERLKKLGLLDESER